MDALDKSQSGWLKEYFDTKITALEKAIEQARISMEKRLDGMNEFRDTLKDQAARMPTRVEMNTEIEKLEKDIKELTKFKDTLEGKASQKDVNSARVIAYVGLAIALFNLFLNLVTH